jgi:hypothetical protein
LTSQGGAILLLPPRLPRRYAPRNDKGEEIDSADFVSLAKTEEKMSLRATCPLAFAEALAQAGQGLARLLESYGEQAGGSVAIFAAKSQILISKL